MSADSVTPVPAYPAHRYLVRLTNPQGQVEEHVVPGDECRLGISKFRSRSLKPGDELDVEVSYRTKDGAGKSDGGWTGASRPVQVATVSDNLPPDWRVPVRATEIGSRHLDLEWGQPPGTSAAELECVLCCRALAHRVRSLAACAFRH